MRYVIADVDGQTATLDTVTDTPREYALKFEPIDVVNGKMIAWDEHGNLYHFRCSEPLDEAGNDKLVAGVNVGTWDIEKGDPLLVKIADNQTDTLRKTIVSYLTSSEKRKVSLYGRIFNKKESKATVSLSYSDMDTNDLIDQASTRLVSSTS